MDFTLPEELRMLRDTVARFTREELLPLEKDVIRREAERGEVHVDEVATVAAQQGDHVAAADAESDETAAQVRHLVAQHAVGGGPTAAVDRHAVGRGLIDDVRQVHGGPPLPTRW